MKQYKVGRYALLSAMGFIIFSAGLVLIKQFPAAAGMLKTLP